MSGISLPRPSRPSIAPPTGPLPSLPVAKSRSSNVGPSTRGSMLPSPASANRAVSTSGVTHRPGPKHVTSPSVPTFSANDVTAGPLPAGKSLRKTVSIGSFPQPPKHVGRSVPNSPLSTSSTPEENTMNRRISSISKGTAPPRSSSLQKPRTSNIGGARGLLPRSPLSPPSLLNGGANSVPLENGHLGLPSPPHSRNASPNGSYATSATTFEDVGGDDERGRESKGSKDGKGNVLVSVRVRPAPTTKDSKPETDWEVDNNRALISYRGREGGDYIYDNVFDTQDNNARVYSAAAKRLVRRVMEGYHGTVFAYGMTGTGKTFSMQGTGSNPGVIPLAITDIFSYIRETPHREFLLRVSYLEIYNEKIHDLLAGSGGTQEEIKLREDSKRGVYATPLREEIVQSPTQLLRVIARGDNNRRVAGTQYNARSSRSHAVVQIVVESRERGSAASASENKRSAVVAGGVRVSTLSLIDLAGSEKAADDKERRTEGSHINKSLLTLGTVVGRLASDKDKEKGKGKSDNHLPYRDSKLTRLLQGALSGNSLVSILCTIQIGASGSSAAAATHTSETLNTLKFASRAKNNIVSHAKKADESLATGDAGSRALLDRYRLEIQELRKQLDESKAKEDAKSSKEDSGDDEMKELKKDLHHEKVLELQDKVRHEEQLLEMQIARTALKERIEHLNRLILSSKSFTVNTSRSFSSLSMARGSVASNPVDTRPTSLRSTVSHATLAVPPRSSQHGPNESHGSEEEDSVGENGDGTATQALQIQALQNDLAEKNEYIVLMEKRLLSARRSSHSRVSLSLRGGNSADGGHMAALAEKDAEIASLRSQLEDKERMIAALTSARKKTDVAHDIGSDGSPGSRRTSSNPRSHSEGSSVNYAVKSPSSPVPKTPASPGPRSRILPVVKQPPASISIKPYQPPSRKGSETGIDTGIDSMTKMLQQLQADAAERRRGSLQAVSEKETNDSPKPLFEDHKDRVDSPKPLFDGKKDRKDTSKPVVGVTMDKNVSLNPMVDNR